MIFVTVGSQLPFDRLIKAVEEWAYNNDKNTVIFQVGPGGYLPKEFISSEILKSKQFEIYLKEADVVVGHAGIGTILKSLEIAKPLIIMPRRERFGEHRNDHQVYTAEKFSKYEGIVVARDEEEMSNALDAVLENINSKAISKNAPDSLCTYIHNFLCCNITKRRG